MVAQLAAGRLARRFCFDPGKRLNPRKADLQRERREDQRTKASI
jgi:hypothetical protein